MLVLLMSIVPLNGLSLWAFMRFRPDERQARGAGWFNTATFVIAPVLCALFSFWVHNRLNGQIENQWLPFFAALAWPAAFPVLLAFAALLRNFVFFPRQRA